MRLFACLPVAVLLASCSLFGGDEPKKKKADNRMQLVGRVASLPSGGGFALIEAYGAWRVPAGGLLSTGGPDGRTATLTASGEKLGRFAAADIHSGSLQPGDPVYYRPLKETEDDSSEDSTPAADAPAKDEAKPAESETKPAENSKNDVEKPPEH